MWSGETTISFPSVTGKRRSPSGDTGRDVYKRQSLGSMAVAAVSTGSKISMFFCTPFDALGGTMATWAGQNVGAKKLDRVREGVQKASLMGFAYSAAAFAALFFCGRYLALLFVDSSETELIRQISTFLICNSVFYICLLYTSRCV